MSRGKSAAVIYPASGLMVKMILRIQKAEVRGLYRLWLSFNDGTLAEVDVLPLLGGPVFEALHDPAYFDQMSLDTVCGTVVWPNGADFAPEALYALMDADLPKQIGAATLVSDSTLAPSGNHGS
jgi:hypothetical protein